MNSSNDRDQYRYDNNRSVNLTQDDDRIAYSNKKETPENHNSWSASGVHQDHNKTKLSIRMSSPSTNVLLDERSSKSITTTTRIRSTKSMTTTTTPRTCTDTTTCDLPPGYELYWEIELIRIIPSHLLSSSLGAVIIRDDFHATPNNSTNADADNIKKSKKPHCRVKGLFEHGLGIQCGLKVDDWFLCSMATSTTTTVSDQEIERYTKYGPLKLATFEEIQRWSTEFPYRPLRVLRRRQQPQPRTNKETEAGIMDTQVNRESKTIAATENRETTSTFCSTIATTSQKRKSAGIASTAASTTFLETAAVTKKKKQNTVDPTCAYCEESFDSIEGLQIHQSRWCQLKPEAKNGNNNNNKNNNKKSECNAYNDDSIDDDDDCSLNHTTMTMNINQINNINSDNPFCRLCNQTKTSIRIHHPWCSKNPGRDMKKVDKLLARIKHGMGNLRCNACRIEYQTGIQIIKKNKNVKCMEGHNKACMKYQKQVRNEQIQRDKEKEREYRKNLAMKKERTSVTETASSSRKRGQASERKRTGNDCNSSSSNSSLSSSSSEEDDDDGSVFKPITKRTRRIQTLTFSQILNKQSRQLNRKSSQMEEEESATVATVTTIANNNNGCRVKPRWVPLLHDDQDPWGEKGWQIEDVLLYGPRQRGIGRNDIQPSNWYAMYPFNIGSNYRLTHTTPEEGTKVLYLNRDSLGNMPWGFEVSRHDPGHACLIETVYQNSPASAATFVGIPSSEKEKSACALNVNDMIVMINGKPVGGMSEVEFNMELEISSPQLLVGISKYKYTEIAATEYRELEQKLLQLQDSIARDDRLIGWQEIGNGKEPTTQAKALPSVATPENFKPGLDRSELKEHNALSLVSTQNRTKYVTPQSERELITELSANTNQGKGDGGGLSPISIDSTSISNKFSAAALLDAAAAAAAAAEYDDSSVEGENNRGGEGP